MSDPDRIRLSIADDHTMFVEAIRLILNAHAIVDVVSLAANGADLLNDVGRLQPDIALVDISMDGPRFQDMARAVAREHGSTRLIALTMHFDRDLARRVMAAGFCGYVVKDAAVEELIEAIQTVHNGSTYLSRALRGEDLPDDTALAPLTPRELACLRCAEQGQSNKDAAEVLGISERTVKFHFENVFRKLQVKSRGEAVAVARRYALL